MKILNHKKGQLDMLGQLGVGIAMLAILLVITFLILAQGKTQVVSEAGSNATLDELVVYVNNTPVALANSPDTMTVSCSRVINSSDGTDGAVIGPGNYTCDSSGLTLTDPVESDGVWNTTVTANYTVKYTTAAWNATQTLQGANATIPPWIPLVVIVVIGGVLILLVQQFRRP